MQEVKEKNFLDIFKSNFSKFQNRNIVLYGIGIKTQSLLENLRFNFIGLMDKEPKNIGKTFFGLKVLSPEQVIKSADLIIIVSGDVYFHTIFSRIEFLQKEHNIPIYFCDGIRAKSYEYDKDIQQNPYWQKTLESLKSEIDKNGIISFDIFDTLITRKITEPVDLLKLIEKHIGYGCDFTRDRIKAELDLGNSATLENIYKKLSNDYKIDHKFEQELEFNCVIPRFDIVEAFNYAIKQKKDVYLISDIYHDKEFIVKLLKKAGIDGYKDIILSCELGKRKSDNSLWKHYLNIVKDKKALHIGDNQKDDIENAKSFGLNTFYIYNPYKMLKNSTLKNIVPKICTLQESVITGNIISRIFNSPFALAKTKGQPLFDNLEDIGYVFYAPILFAYLTWILKENIKSKTDKTLFLARDGYFLEKLYNLLIKKLGIKNAPEAEYLMISRALITILNLKDETDIENALKIKFQGRMKDYFKIRFGIDIENEEIINTSADAEKMRQVLNSNKTRILENAKEQRELYSRYISKVINRCNNLAIVDPSYNGTNQHFLSKFLNRDIKGYYCNANLSKCNPYFSGNNMSALFQLPEDFDASKSNLRKNTLFFEDGILVAPTGTCLKINEDLSFDFSPPGNTQKSFDNKEKTYDGIVEFFNDILANYNSIDDIKIPSQFVDFIVGEIYSKNTLITQEIKDTFFVDTMYETVYDRKMFE